MVGTTLCWYWYRDTHISQHLSDTLDQLLHVALVKIPNVANSEAGSCSDLPRVNHLIWKTRKQQ